MKAILFFLLSIVFVNPITAQKQTKLVVGQEAPEFIAVDSNNDTIRLSDLKGKKVYLTLYRNVGCAVCNLRFNEIESLKDNFKSKNIVVLGVYESSASKLKEYVQEDVYYTKLIADPEFKIYNDYGDELSSYRTFKSIFHGVFSKAKKGSKLFKKKIEQDGNKNRIGAEFIIDEKGIVLVAHYHRFVGDHLTIESINKSLE